MARDTYTELVNTPLGRRISGALGLPQPSRLRRHRPGAPVIDGPVALVGRSTVADRIGEVLLGWGLDVRRHPDPGERIAAVVACFDDVAAPGDLSAPVMELSGLLRQVGPSGRVITVSRRPGATSDPAARAARQGVEGLTRSLAHEMRRGATANGIQLAEDLDADAPGVAGALRFLLSGRSAYVSGQFLTVDTVNGELPRRAEGWDRPLAGQVAVVTGAARGIGAAITEVLRRDGAEIIAVDVPAAGEQLAATANRVRGTALQLDVTAQDAGERLVAHAAQHHGRLDIVVHNAGITRDKLLANMTPDRWDSVIAVNIESQLRINRALLASELFDHGPRIVSLASTSGIAGNRGQSNYAASKAGVMGMVSASQDLLGSRHGTINAVAPGFIETEMTAKIPPITRQVARRLSSLNQGGLPVDVAETIAFLASPSAGGTSGLTLRVCGQNLVGA
ncbi:MAG: 3-oxoacyl-ACP reductase [Nesterenkonia sp.]|nr:3-oxoacyl-ACP reductase [Nesterenkonia sp.]